jgi:hypothetical protein
MADTYYSVLPDDGKTANSGWSEKTKKGDP